MAVLRFLILSLLGVWSTNVLATGCYNALGSVVNKETSMGNITISVPPDMPIGSEIYRIRAVSPTEAGNVGVICSVSQSMYWYFDYGDILYPESSVSSPYGGRMFETNIPGISVVYMASGTVSSGAYTKGFPYQHAPGAYSDMFLKNNPVAKEFALIKTGDIQPGIITGASLPTAVFSGGQSGDMHEILRYRLTGQITVTVPTCQIESPNKVVQMGSHLISGTFTGIGSTTAWEDASIRLINCPTFYGNRGTTTSLTYFGIAPVRANIWALSLQPVFGTIDDAQGIISLDSSGPADASGIGIQLATAQNESSFIHLNEEFGGDFPTDGVASLSIPIFARYIQTETHVTPGRADSSVIYQLEYR